MSAAAHLTPTTSARNGFDSNSDKSLQARPPPAHRDHHRPTAVTYHGGEVITTTYGSPGVPVGLSSMVSPYLWTTRRER